MLISGEGSLYSLYAYFHSQEVFFCDPDGYTNTATVTFQFGCESCPAAETAFFFRIDIQTLGR